MLPSKRPYNYFNIGDKIFTYLVLKDDPSKSGWYSGEVRFGYRHHDGCVSFRLDGIGPQDETDPEFKGHYGSGMQNPAVLKLEEFVYFYEHSDEYVKWHQEAIESLYSEDIKVFHAITEQDYSNLAKLLLLL